MSDKVKKEIFNSVNENVQALAKLFPSVVKDGEVDFDALKEELGEFVEVGAEKYDFTWAGKSKAKAEARDSGEGLTLKLKVGEGVNEDTTQNIYIEGDNLKALKLLRNSYYGAIKMIYIDPPYNTGKDFVYRDNFTLSQEELDELGNNLDDEGNRLEKNSGDSARYHTDWLNMMYPRLKIARDLLTEDGVMFISIDDNEIENTLRLVNSVFGETNLVNIITVKTNETKGLKNSSVNKSFPKNKEYLVIVAKNVDFLNFYTEKIKKTEEELRKYVRYYNKYIDNVNEDCSKWVIKDFGLLTEGKTEEEIFALKDEYKEKLIYFVSPDNFDEEKIPKDNECFYKVVNSKGVTIYYYRDENGKVNTTLFLASNYYKNLGDLWTDISTININKEVVDMPTYSNGQKPVKLLERVIKYMLKDEEGIVLDFFSGSSTTAQAVMQLNTEDGRNRKFIMVQLPENLDENIKKQTPDQKKNTQKLIDFLDSINKEHTIPEYAKERIRRAGAKIKAENGLTAPNLDVGFKVFEVAETNIRMFSEEMKGNDLFDFMQQTDKELRDFMPDTKDIDVCYELLLRHRGVALSSSIEKLDIGERTYIIADSIVVCLDSEVTEEMVEKLAVIDPQPMKYIFRDSAFGDDISLKENTMIMLSALIEKTTGESKKAYKVEFI